MIAEIGQFLLDHWLLSSLFVILMVMFVVNEFIHRSRGIPQLSPEEVVDLINHSRGVVIDLRGKPAFSAGHILNALNIPNEDLDKQLNQLKKYQSRPIILVCPNGISSLKSAGWLKARDFTNVKILRGGLESWKASDLPLTAKA